MFKVSTEKLMLIAGVVWFIAFFYTGIGFALMMAGVDFVVRYVRTGHQGKCPVVADRS